MSSWSPHPCGWEINLRHHTHAQLSSTFALQVFMKKPISSRRPPFLTNFMVFLMAISKIGNGESRNGERGTGNGEREISKIGNI